MSFLNLSVRTFLLLACSGFASHAQVVDLVLQPPGLDRGDQYRLIFVTSQQRDALSTNIDDYNQFVQSVADASPVVGSWGLDWKAIASTDAVDARDNVNANANDEVLPVFRVDGSVFANVGDPIFIPGGNPRTARVRFTELGTLPTPFDDPPNSGGFRGAAVWTVTDGDGTANVPLGGSPRTGDLATIGDTEFGSFLGYTNGFQRLEVGAHFYALSEVVTAVPEPSSFYLVSCVLVCLFSRLCRRTRRGAIAPSL